MLDTVDETASWTTSKIRAVRTLHENAKRFVCDNALKIYSHGSVDMLFVQTYAPIQNLVEGPHRQTADRLGVPEAAE
jgi:hypothetical protein